MAVTTLKKPPVKKKLTPIPDNDNTIGLVKSKHVPSDVKLPEFFKREGGVCSFLFENRDGTTDKFREQGCHARALTYGNPLCTGFYSSIWKNFKNDKTYDAATSELAEYLHSPERSPWRALLTDGSYYTIEKDYGWYYIPVTQDTNHQLLCHFAVANRHFWERPNNVIFWKQLKDAGLTESEAYYLLSYFYNNGVISTLTPSNHYPFHSYDRSDYRIVRDGISEYTVGRKTVEKYTGSYFGNGALPMSVLFNLKNTQSKVLDCSRVRSLFEAYLKRLKNKDYHEYKGMFSRSRQEWSVYQSQDKPINPTVKNVVAFALENREALGLT